MIYESTVACGSMCPAVTPPALANGGRIRVPGTGYEVDDKNIERIALRAGERTVDIQLQATGTQNTDLLRVLALEVDSSGNPIAEATAGPIEVPASSSAIARLALLPATNYIGTNTGNQSLERVWIWPQLAPTSADAAECVALQHGNGGSREFFVPSYDFDCDSVAAECAPTVYLANQGPDQIGHGTCATHETGTGYCKIGGPGCNETSPTAQSGCMPVRGTSYCMPDAMCTALAPSTCPTWMPLCLAGPPIGTPMFEIDCKIAIGSTTAACAGNSGTGTFDASGALLGDTTQMCAALGLSAVQDFPDFQSTFTPLTGAPTFALTGLVNNACTAMITWTGATPALDTVTSYVGLVDVTLSSDVHRVFALHFFANQVGDCAMNSGPAISCQFTASTPDASFAQCM